MANKKGKRITNVDLLKKIETLDSQLFMQRVLLDEMENRLETLQKRLDDQVTIQPFNYPSIPLPPLQPQIAPYYGSNTDYCVDMLGHVYSGQSDLYGNRLCSKCGNLISSPVSIINTTNTSDKITYNTPDISWSFPDGTTQKIKP